MYCDGRHDMRVYKSVPRYKGIKRATVVFTRLKNELKFSLKILGINYQYRIYFKNTVFFLNVLVNLP